MRVVTGGHRAGVRGRGEAIGHTLGTCFSGGRSISTNEVSVKPAMIAACVPTAEKFELKSFNSFSRNSIDRCFTFDWSSSLSAASMLSWGLTPPAG